MHLIEISHCMGIILYASLLTYEWEWALDPCCRTPGSGLAGSDSTVITNWNFRRHRLCIYVSRKEVSYQEFNNYIQLTWIHFKNWFKNWWKQTKTLADGMFWFGTASWYGIGALWDFRVFLNKSSAWVLKSFIVLGSYSLNKMTVYT